MSSTHSIPCLPPPSPAVTHQSCHPTPEPAPPPSLLCPPIRSPHPWELPEPTFFQEVLFVFKVDPFYASKANHDGVAI
ncbi:hypothetical protein EDD16DRAFT_1705439 [Pisolithus croceorrhizus]|nr:hypothetical protein EV401DRAFT_2078790 [Pisolithus croceorrhizus]KAI6120942.1 hypothetical protein EDD16DRAFT_1705439 [Pisolithus croceorrhizus]KAI6152793.1 hypothetical protein EDD17DRAFT_1765367 [Pisolithus thermaeus]